MGHMGPFADTQVDLGAVEDQNGFGWLYVCKKCVGTMAALFGFETPEQVAARSELMASADARITELEAQLEAERENKVVKLSELEDMGVVLVAPPAFDLPAPEPEPEPAKAEKSVRHVYSGWEPPTLSDDEAV
jgi:hypothetical protein